LQNSGIIPLSCPPESAYTTGQTLFGTGGYAMYLPGD